MNNLLMESNPQTNSSFLKTMFQGLSKKVVNLINLNIDGKLFKDQEICQLSLNDCPSLNSSYAHNHQDTKMKRQEYLNSISEENDTINERQYNSNNNSNNHNNNINHQNLNYHNENANTHHIQGLTTHSNNKEKEGNRSNCSSLNSAFRILNNPNRNRNRNGSDILDTRTIHQNSSTLVKRQRDSNKNDISHSKRPKLEEKAREKNEISNTIMVNEDISMRSYKSYLSNTQGNNSRISNKNLKSLEEIKKEIELKKKEAENKIDAFKQSTIPIKNTKELYEEKKQILIDYYKEKAQSLKEVTIMIEKEKMKKESNFNQLKQAKNEMISIKGKEKSKPKEEIIKQTGLFIEKVYKPKVDFKESNDVNDSLKVTESQNQNRQSLFQQEDKNEKIVLGLERNISFSADNSLFDWQTNKSDIGNKFDLSKDKDIAKPKENFSKQPETTLFNKGLFDNNSDISFMKPDTADKKGQLSLFPEANFSQNGTKEEKEKAIEKPLLDSFFSFSDNKDKDVKDFNAKANNNNITAPSTNSNSLFSGFNKHTGLIDNTVKEDKATISLFNSNNNQKPMEQLFNQTSSANTISIFDRKSNSPMKPNDGLIFKSNNSLFDNKTKERTTTNDQPLFLTPQQSSLNKDEQIKNLLQKNESTPGSLLHDNNPFINTNKPEIADIFKSPAKQIPQTSQNNFFNQSQFQSQPQPQKQLFNQQTSIFPPNQLNTNNNISGTSSLFVSNTISNPVTQGTNPLFSAPQKSLFP